MSTQLFRQLLQQTRTIAVVGLSRKPWRASFAVSEYMQASGYRIIPVNPHEGSVLGETAYTRLEDVPVPVDMVNIFRRSDAVPEVVDAAIRIRAKSIWMQLGVEHEEAAQRALDAGLLVVMDRCLEREHRALKSQL